MTAASFRSALAGISLTRALIGLGILLVAINIASAIWDVRADRQRTELRALRDFSNLANILAEQTAASLEAADAVLREAQRDQSAAAIAASAPRLHDELMHIPQVAAFLVLDASGRVLARTNDMPTLAPELGERAFFAAHRKTRSEGLMLSSPYQVDAGGQWRFVLSRRLTLPDGAFDGVVAAVIEVDRFDRLYRSIALGEGSFITLLSHDGVIVTRVPDPTGMRGRTLPGDRLPDWVQSEAGFLGWTESPVMNERVLLAARKVRGFPLQMMAGSPEKAVLAPWHAEAWRIGVRTLLSSSAMLALIAFAAWGLARRERALADSGRLFRAMIEHSSDAVLLTRPNNGGIFYASPSLARITGHELASIRGREPLEWLHPDHQAAALRQRQDLLRTPGKSAISEILIRRRDGAWQWMESTVTNLLEDPGVRAVVINLRDISERKLAESERARLEQRLRQAEKMEAVGRLAGGIAHDFNNILGGILGYSEMLVEGTAEGTRERRYAQNVLTAANRASALVEQILWYSRSQRGKRVPVELDRVAAETLELVKGSLAHGIRLELELPAKPISVMGDSTQLHQVIMNLCTNAMHAMGEHGTLRVRLDETELEMERALSHSTLQPGRYARLMVEDTGAGMEPAVVARVFEPFFTTKEVGKGTGLGLSLVYGIVTDSSGAIDVASTVGQGSRFTIYLPRVDTPGLAEDGEAAPLERGRGERVLVVDDEDALVAMTQEVLRRLGYEPVGCADGVKALAAFQAEPQKYDAVLTDEVMPGLSGTDLARSLRERRADLPIVLVSGYIGPMMTERAAAAGVNEILKKPVQSRELASALARVLRHA